MIYVNLKFRRAALLKSHKETHAAQVKNLICSLWPQCKKVKNANGLSSSAANLRVHYYKHHKGIKLKWLKLKQNMLQVCIRFFLLKQYLNDLNILFI